MTRLLPSFPLAAVAALAVLAGCGEARTLVGAEEASTACASCHADAATASALGGAHAVHLSTDRLGSTISCADCHRAPTSLDAAGHLDGRVDVTFAERAGGAAARWDPAAGTCAVACHGVSLAGGPAASPPWSAARGERLACGSCHGAPPPAPHPTSARCASCHPATVAEDGGIVAGGGHLNGLLDVPADGGACGSCHGIPPGPPHVTSSACGSCHTGYTATTVNAALHRNGIRDTSSQACGSCHGIPPSSGEHRKHVNEGVSCGGCHPGASSSGGGPGHLSGAIDVAAPGWNASRVSCANACHDGDEERWY